VTTQDPGLESRLDPETGARWMTNYLRALTMELTALARACGKSDVHHLEPDDLVALTVEAAAMAKVPLAGTDWVPGSGDRHLPNARRAAVDRRDPHGRDGRPAVPELAAPDRHSLQ
jgi:hypothetical protein